jgi:hypothetical protein
MTYFREDIVNLLQKYHPVPALTADPVEFNL